MRHLLSIAALALTLTPLPPAAADTGEITCHGGSISHHYTPGVTYRRNTTWMTANGDLGVCASQTHPGITGGTIRIEGNLTSQCPGPIGPGYTRLTISWNDGTTTTVNQATHKGDLTSYTVDSGAAHLSGRTTTSLLDLGANCVLNGVTQTTATIDQFTSSHE
ncbi:hypothetical protein [Herbidospora daliensis]|uniref:hypothetical protein n=1 Tax=Herbidospora daliensis TaxID=295585 RepID=UPI0007821650|nr:hypothetical protein [Herbidospora daliensis]